MLYSRVKSQISLVIVLVNVLSLWSSQPSLQTPGLGTLWALCWEATSASDTMNIFPMATWVTLYRHLDWLSPRVTHLHVPYYPQMMHTRAFALHLSNLHISFQRDTCRTFLQQLTKKALLGSTTQRAEKSRFLKVCVETIVLSIIRRHQWLMCVWMFAEWLAHENAVFDIAWVPGEPQLVSTYMPYHKS